MKKLLFLCAMLVAYAFVFPTFEAGAYTQNDVDRMGTLAAIMGRALACNCVPDSDLSKVGDWIDRTFGADNGKMLIRFTSEMESNFKLQMSGSAPNTCDQVREIYKTISLP